MYQSISGRHVGGSRWSDRDMIAACLAAHAIYCYDTVRCTGKARHIVEIPACRQIIITSIGITISELNSVFRAYSPPTCENDPHAANVEASNLSSSPAVQARGFPRQVKTRNYAGPRYRGS